MTTSIPRISVLIPSYNHGRFIEEAIRSVWSQDYPDMELVVVDDGSTDDSREVIARLAMESPIRMQAIEQQNAGICRTLNRALSVSSGRIIAILASDDVMVAGRLKEEIKYFDNSETLKVLFTNGKFQSNGKCFGDLHKPIKRFLKRGIADMRRHLLSTAPGFYSQARLIKREFLVELGGFDEETGSDDWSLHIRMFQALKTQSEYQFIDRVSFFYRVHQNQMHKANDFMSSMKRKVIRKYFPVENRSKAVCEEYVKRAIILVIQKRYRLGWRYLRLAARISFVNQIPWNCIARFGIRMPAYLFRVAKRHA